LGHLNAPAAALFSTLGRTAARGVECKQTAGFMRHYYDQLVANIKAGKYDTFNADMWNPDRWPNDVKGFGFTEAPRGALGHWIHIKNK